MELDELKKAWKQDPIHKHPNTDIMELIQQKSYGPIAALKTVFRKQILFMALIPFILLLTNMQDVTKPLTSILFWAYVLFCTGVILFAVKNYRIAQEMETLDGAVKTRLERRIQILEERVKRELLGMRLVMLSFIVLLEIVPYIQHYSMLDKWHSLNPAIRFGAYAGLVLLQYFMNRKISERKVGRHLSYLKRLVNDLES